MYRIVVDPSQYEVGEIPCGFGIYPPASYVVNDSGTKVLNSLLQLDLKDPILKQRMERFLATRSCTGRFMIRFRLTSTPSTDGGGIAYFYRFFGNLNAAYLLLTRKATGKFAISAPPYSTNIIEVADLDLSYHTYEIRYSKSYFKFYWDGNLVTTVTPPAALCLPASQNQDMRIYFQGMGATVAANMSYFEVGEYPIDIFSDATDGVQVDGQGVGGMNTYWYLTSVTPTYTIATSATGSLSTSGVSAGTYRVCGVDAYGYSFCKTVTIT